MFYEKLKIYYNLQVPIFIIRNVFKEVNLYLVVLSHW